MNNFASTEDDDKMLEDDSDDEFWGAVDSRIWKLKYHQNTFGIGEILWVFVFFIWIYNKTLKLKEIN